MANVTNVLSSTGEDFVDELTSLIVFKEGNSIFGDIKKKLDLKEDSVLDEAIEGALSTLQYGMMNMVIVLVTEYALTKSVFVLSSLFTYIKGRRIVRNIAKATTSIVSKLGPVGWAVGKSIDSVTNVLVANQNETLAIANMANSSSNNLISAVGQERQNQIMIKGQKLKRVDNTKNNMYSVRNKAREKNMDLYVHKFETGTWRKTPKDKKLYFDNTGQNPQLVVFNTDFVKKLNSYSKYYETAQGDIYNETKATFELMTQLGVSRGK